ncbi:arginine--tRNA ligase [Porphyromonas asaccharolytica]|uniref:arginine--tRNA ligase n=1 Tax=Porphyromonas asaccharolytica TaxID=28123 RepID=UPI00248E855A|nr:arginine--tRNA ligase [Porphyromonas asaccharolytica]
MSLYRQLSEAIASTLHTLYGLTITADEITLTATRPEFEGHMTLVVFPYLKASHKSPQETAETIGAKLQEQTDLIASYGVVKGFLNLTLTDTVWISALREIAETPHYGHITPTAQSPLVMIEYSSPNTNKPLHLGHVRNNLLGYSLAQILEASGHRVVKTNIVNDRGVHICKSMLAWLRWGNGETPESSGKKGDHLIGDYYVRFDKEYRAELAQIRAAHPDWSDEEVEAKSQLMADARQMLRQWEQGDPEVRALWRQMNEWVYKGFDETYSRMGVSFDKIYYESDTYLVGREEVLRGLKEGLFERHEDGSVWADFEAEGLDKKILLRSDGTSVYITQDIGTAKLRYQDFPIDQMIYVVGNEQEYHFQVLSLLLDRLGYKWGKSLTHFSYGMVELPNGKMKSREGTVVDADDLMDAMRDTALEVARTAQQAKGVELAAEPTAEELRTAEMVGLGALKYFILKVDPRKNMMFNPEESIDFNGNTGPFIQYTYARICSLLQKADEMGYKHQLPEGGALALSSYETALVQQLLVYPTVVQEAAESYSPARIANYTYDLVKGYNQFYHECSVLREEDEALRSMRLQLSKTVAETIHRAMGLLGIALPERM